VPRSVETIVGFYDAAQLLRILFEQPGQLQLISAFSRCTIESVTIPDSVERIIEVALSDRRRLKFIVFLPTGRNQYIGGFRRTAGESVDLSDALQVVGRQASLECSELEVVTTEANRIDRFQATATSANLSCQTHCKKSVLTPFTIATPSTTSMLGVLSVARPSRRWKRSPSECDFTEPPMLRVPSQPV
jgi:hypothetical protein